MSYIQGFVIPVPTNRKDDYVKMARDVAPMFMEYGATRIVETWGDDIPDGKTTDFRKAVKAEEGEAVVFSWIVWPSKEVYQAAHGKMMADERMKTPPADMPFDGKRMIFGGFVPVMDTDED